MKGFEGCRYDDVPMDNLTKKRRKLLYDIAIHGEGLIRLKTLQLLRNVYGLTYIYYDGREVKLDIELIKLEKELENGKDT